MSDYASVEQRTQGLMQEIYGDLEPYKPGCWIWKYGTVPLGVMVLEDADAIVTDAIVRVFTCVMENVEKHPDLLDTLNTINANMSFGQIYWREGDVNMQANLIGRTLDREELETAINYVGHWADSLDEAFVERFGARAQSMGAEESWSPQPGAVPPSAH